MRKLLGLGLVVALLCTLVVSAAQARESAVVNIKFATYVWQPTTVAATKSIVEAWNKSHTNIQVEIVAVDPNSVHDKLLTNFVGGTAADVIHDEAADIAGFTEQGYLANLTPLLPKTLKSSIPKDIWSTVNFGRKITGVPSLMQTYNIFANMAIFKEAGVKAPTLADPWTWVEFRAAAKKLTNSSRFGVCWGLRTPTAVIQTTSLNYGGQFNYLQNGKWIFRWGAAEQNVVRQMHDMIHVDKSVDPAATGLSGSGVLPGVLRRQVCDDRRGQLPGPGHDPAEPQGVQLGDVPAAQGNEPESGRKPADVLDRPAEQQQGRGDAVHRLRAEHPEPGEARGG